MGEKKRSLSDLFGEPAGEIPGPGPAREEFGSGLAELFRRIDDEGRVDAAASPPQDAAHTSAVEQPSTADSAGSAGVVVDAGADAAGAGVDAAVAGFDAAGAGPDAAGAPPVASARRRPFRLGVTVAAAAVVLMLGVGVVAVVGQNPRGVDGTQALDALISAEAALSDAEQTLDSAHERVVQAQRAGVADADRADALLALFAGLSDEAARTTALTAVAEYRTGADGLALPDVPTAYDRADGELAPQDIDAVLETVDERRTLTQELIGQVSTAESELLEMGMTFASALDAFLATIPAFAEAVNAENAQADEQFRAAVTAAAASASAPDAGEGAVQTYAAAVAALRADQARALEEARVREEQQPVPVEPAEPVPPPAPEPPPPPPPEPEPTPEPTLPPPVEPTP